MSKKRTVDILMIHAADLSLHPQLSRLAIVADTARHFATTHHGDAQRKEWAEDLAESWNSLVLSIKDDGIRQPLHVQADPARPGHFFIVDGRHRFQAGLEIGLEVFPCQIETAEDAGRLVFRSLFNRNHFTKSIRAYAAVLMHPEVAGVKRGRASNREVDPILGVKCAISAHLTAETLAAQAGVSRRLLEQAKAIFRTLSESEPLRLRVEPTIWAGAELGAVLAGIAGANSTAGEPRPASSHISVLRGLRTLKTQLRDFGNWPAEEREAMHTCAAEWARTIPPAAAAMLREALEDAAGEAAA